MLSQIHGRGVAQPRANLDLRRPRHIHIGHREERGVDTDRIRVGNDDVGIRERQVLVSQHRVECPADLKLIRAKGREQIGHSGVSGELDREIQLHSKPARDVDGRADGNAVLESGVVLVRGRNPDAKLRPAPIAGARAHVDPQRPAVE